MIHVGHVREIVRYPVKSMAGIATESALLGWHGLDGDRRFAFRRMGDDGGFPWLSASRLPELLLYQPVGLDESTGEPLPTHVRTPNGSCLELRSAELKAELGERLGSDVDLMKLKHGIFDEAAISVISLATIAGIGREAGLDLDRRRFRANIVVETGASEPFLEDAWVGGTLVFGASDPSVLDGSDARLSKPPAVAGGLGNRRIVSSDQQPAVSGDQRPAVRVTMCDLRCVMINLDPETAEKDARVMKTVVRLNQNNAGVYATVLRTGTIHVGDRVNVVPATSNEG